MNKTKINEYKEVKEFLKNKSLKAYEIDTIEHFYNILNDFDFNEILTQEEKSKIEQNAINIINGYNYLDCEINAENKTDLMIFLMLAYLTGRSTNDFSKWKIADYLEYNNLFEVLEDRAILEEELESIKYYLTKRSKKKMIYKYEKLRK